MQSEGTPENVGSLCERRENRIKSSSDGCFSLVKKPENDSGCCTCRFGVGQNTAAQQWVQGDHVNLTDLGAVHTSSHTTLFPEKRLRTDRRDQSLCVKYLFL